MLFQVTVETRSEWTCVMWKREKGTECLQVMCVHRKGLLHWLTLLLQGCHTEELTLEHGQKADSNLSTLRSIVLFIL